MSLAAQIRAARAGKKARNAHAPVSQHVFECTPAVHENTRARGRKASRQSMFGFNGGKIHHETR